MRLLTHNTLRNNAGDAGQGGFPLKITATEVRVDDPSFATSAAASGPAAAFGGEGREVAFVRGVLPVLDWPALVQGANDLGLKTLPPTFTEEAAAASPLLHASLRLPRCALAHGAPARSHRPCGQRRGCLRSRA